MLCRECYSNSPQAGPVLFFFADKHLRDICNECIVLIDCNSLSPEITTIRYCGEV